VGRAELLAAAGYLGAALAFLARLDAPSGSARRAALAAVTLLAAALAYGGKESALTLPAALALLALWDARGRGVPASGALRAEAPVLLGTVALASLYLTGRDAVLGTAVGGGQIAAGLEGLDAAGRTMVMLPAVLVWARLLLVPVRLSADYAPDAFVPRLAFGPSHVAALGIIVLFVALALRVRRRAPAAGLGLLWFAITVAVAANVLVPTGVLLAERLLYLPSVGAALALGAGWTLLPEGRWRWPVTAAILAMLAARSLERIPVWRDNERFFETMERDAPRSYRTRWMKGSRAFARGDVRAGERELLAALRIHPADAVLAAELGSRYAEAGLFVPADRFLAAALRLDSGLAQAAPRLVLSRLRASGAEAASALADSLVPRFPEDPAVLAVAHAAHMEAQRPRRALAVARRLVWLDRSRWQHHQMAAHAALRADRCAEARIHVAQAEELAPSVAAPRELAAQVAQACRGAR
jgi:tetratricopeptide (TPR) repeat protein